MYLQSVTTQYIERFKENTSQQLLKVSQSNSVITMVGLVFIQKAGWIYLAETRSNAEV